MISGSTGLSGCVDGSMVLLESKRGSRKAVLHCIGRDIENREIELQFDSDLHRWIALSEPAGTKEKDNPFLSARRRRTIPFSLPCLCICREIISSSGRLPN